MAQLILRGYSACPDAVVGSLVAWYARRGEKDGPVHVCACSLLELPHKTDLMATLVGVLNVGNRELVGLVLERLNSHMDSLAWWQAAQVPRVMVELANARVLTPEGLNAFLLATCTELLGPSQSGELVATAVLLALPWIGSELYAQLPALEQVMNLLGALVESDKRFSCKLAQCDVRIAAELEPEQDSLRTCYMAVRTMGSFPGKTEPYGAFAAALKESQPHGDFVAAWSAESLRVVRCAPFAPLRLFADTFDAETGQFAVFYYQFMLHMLVEAYELNHRRAAEVLFACLPDKIASPERAICQVLFGKLVRASTRASAAYYEILLIDCCRLSRMFPPVMARSLLKLVSRLDATSDLGVIGRLATWFAHHLSHYDFKWNWEEWRAVGEEQTLSTRRVFVRLLVYKLLLLSYHEKLQSVLPEWVLGMLPSASAAPTPSAAVSRELVDLMRKRPPLDELVAFISREQLAKEAVFEAVLLLGSKTYSHLLNALERYYALLKDLSTETQLAFIATAASFWADHAQNFHIVLEKLMHYRIVMPDTIADWLLARAAESFSVLTVRDVTVFECDILIRTLSIDFLLVMIAKTEAEERTAFARSLVDRLGQLEMSVRVGEEAVAGWLKWTVSGVIRGVLHGHFLARADSRMELVALAQSSSAYGPAIHALVSGAADALAVCE